MELAREVDVADILPRARQETPVLDARHSLSDAELSHDRFCPLVDVSILTRIFDPDHRGRPADRPTGNFALPGCMGLMGGLRRFGVAVVAVGRRNGGALGQGGPTCLTRPLLRE